MSASAPLPIISGLSDLSGRYDAVLLARSILTPTLSAAAVACCVLWGRRALRQEGIHLHLRWRDA